MAAWARLPSDLEKMIMSPGTMLAYAVVAYGRRS